MAELLELNDDRLVLVLRSVGEHLDVGADGGIPAVPAVTVRGAGTATPRRRWHRSSPLLRAAAILIAVVALGFAVSPVRRTVAGWLSIGSTEITMRIDEVADRAPLPELRDGSRPISAGTAAARVPAAAVGASSIGAPDRWAIPLEGGVIAVWREGATTLWVRSPEMGADMLLSKLVDAGEQARSVDHLGDDALAVAGDHVLVTPSRSVAAGTVVLWVADGREYRLESDLPLDEMVAIARAIDRAG